MSTLTVGRLVGYLEIDKKAWSAPLRDADRDLRDLERDAAKHLDAVAKSFTTTGRQADDTGKKVSTASKDMATSVEAASRRLSAAHDAVAEAAEEMTRAHTALEFERLVGDADKLAAAEHRLERSLRQVAHAGREAGAATDSLARARQAQTAAAEKEAEASGSRIGDKLSQGVRRAATSGITYALPAMAAGGIQLGSALGGGVILGFGAGIAGLGIMAQKENEIVLKSYVDMSSRVAARADHISKPWIGTLLQISHVAEQTWHTLEDELEGALDRLAPATGKFVTNVGKAVAQFGPALEPISRAAEAVMDDLGGRLPGIVDGLADALADLAESVEKNPEALGDMVEAIGKVLEAGIQLIDFLTEVKGHFDDLNPVVKAFVAPWTVLDDAWNQLNGTGDGVTTTLDDIGSATRGATAQTEALEKRQKEAAQAAKQHAQALNDLVDAAYDYINAGLGLRGAIDSAEESFADYTKAVRDHKVGSEEASDAQLRAEEAALRVAAAARDAALAEQEFAGQTQNLGAAQVAARAKLIELAASASGPLKAALLNQIAILDQVIAKLNGLDRTFNARVNIHVSQTGQAAPGLNLPALKAYARGGSIKAGEIGEVAEGGRPEMLTSQGKNYLLMGNAPGYITPSDQLAAAAGGSGGGAGGVTRLEVLVRTAPGLDHSLGAAVVNSLAYEVRTQYGGDITRVGT